MQHSGGDGLTTIATQYLTLLPLYGNKKCLTFSSLCTFARALPHLVNAEFRRALLGQPALVELGNEAVCPRHCLGRTAGNIISEQAALRTVFPLGQKDGVQQAAYLVHLLLTIPIT